MTLDKAIKHCEEVAEQNEAKALRIGQQYKGTLLNRDAKECRECATEHRQLAGWLTELKQWRRVYGVCPSYEMCIPECKEGYNAQIAEYKRLLKAAVEDFRRATQGCIGIQCDSCPHTSTHKGCVWRYADEALKLIES